MTSLAAMAGGVRALLATGSPSFRRLGRAPEAFTDAELTALIVAEPRLLRRPLAVHDGQLLIGARAVSQPREPGR